MATLLQLTDLDCDGVAASHVDLDSPVPKDIYARLAALGRAAKYQTAAGRLAERADRKLLRLFSR